jgi:predicted amidohydrolase
MDKPIIALIQHKLLVTKSLDELTEYFHRFLRIAKTKGSHVAIFPEYSGLAVGIPMFPGWRNALLKEAATPKQGILPRLKGMIAGGAANVVRADLRKSLLMTLSEMPESLYDVYVNVFSDLARQYDMIIVAGSLYFYDVELGAIRNGAFVFGSDGSLLGRQDQVMPDPETLEIADLAPGWEPIDTPAGRIGILFGPEALYPEPGRVLAYQGADMLITLAATKRPATYHKIRHAAMARCQENQLYGAAAFLVGPDPFAGPDEPLFMGRSAIFAPLDFTPRFSGVMTELGSAQAEGVITAEWDYPALHELWQSSETPLRTRIPLEQVALLAQIYGEAIPLETAAPAQPPAALPQAEEEGEPSQAVSDMLTDTLPADEELPIFTPILPTEPPVIPLGEPAQPAEEAAAALPEAEETGPDTTEENNTPDQEPETPASGASETAEADSAPDKKEGEPAADDAS